MTGEFGSLLRELRLRMGWTQDELADRSGVSAHSISTLESGRRRPRLSSVSSFADALDLGPAERDRLLAAARTKTGEGRAPSTASGLTRPAQLTADLADFTGRREVVRRLEALLTTTGADRTEGPVVLSAIDGAGGMGKTSLAVHVAHRIRSQFPDGQLQVDLRGAGGLPADPYDVLAQFLRGLGLRPERIPAALEERGALYRSTLAGQRVLVLLDDARDAAQIRPLLPGSGTCSVLVTSRSVLPGLDGAHRFSLGVLPADEALALFTRIVGGDAVAAEPAAVAAVLKVCAGLPLAIRIAASRLVARPGWTVGDLAERLADERGGLGELTVEDRAVRTCFAVSYRNLQPDEARTFRLLGLCEGPSFSAPAAAALLARPVTVTEQIMDALTDIHLLQSPSAGRYRFHDLLRAYAAERTRMEDPEERRDAATHRMLSWYLHSSAAASRTLNPTRRHVTLDPAGREWRSLEFGNPEQALTWSESEGMNLVAAVSQATRTGRHEIGWKLPITMWDLFNRRSQHAGRIDCYETALVSARALGDPEATAWVLNGLSSAYRAAGRLPAAVDCLREALAIRGSLADVHGEGSCLVNLGYVRIEMGQAAEAVEDLDRALAIFRRLGVPMGEAATRTNLGEAHRQLGDFAAALDHYGEALTIYREASDAFHVGRGVTNLAETLFLLGRLDQAAELAGQGRALNRESGNRLDEAIALDVLGQVHAARGRPALAADHWRHAQAIFVELGHARAADITARLGRRPPR